mmetsp:Transcript_44604/g.142186  ORF Transcript_44604/g.142186 Transcript_44604/m.142186 type:complete len:86 (-) Transcript_44604:49-306(-)
MPSFAKDSGGEGSSEATRAIAELRAQSRSLREALAQGQTSGKKGMLNIDRTLFRVGGGGGVGVGGEEGAGAGAAVAVETNADADA